MLGNYVQTEERFLLIFENGIQVTFCHYKFVAGLHAHAIHFSLEIT